MACAADSKFSNRHVTFESNLESGHPIRIESRSFAGPYLKLRNNYGIGFSVSFGYWLCIGLGLVFRVVLPYTMADQDMFIHNVCCEPY